MDDELRFVAALEREIGGLRERAARSALGQRPKRRDIVQIDDGDLKTESEKQEFRAHLDRAIAEFETKRRVVGEAKEEAERIGRAITEVRGTHDTFAKRKIMRRYREELSDAGYGLLVAELSH